MSASAQADAGSRDARGGMRVASGRGMWLEAILALGDLTHVLDGLTPTTLRLTDAGELHLEKPSTVTLEAGRGLRIIAAVKLRLAVLGLHVPVHITSATVLLKPSVEKHGGRDVLAFRLLVEALDVTALPSLLEGTVVSHVNTLLAEQQNELLWDFGETLSHRFDLPGLLDPRRAFDLTTAWGELRITSEALVFALSVHAKAVPATPLAGSAPHAARASVEPAAKRDARNEARTRRVHALTPRALALGGTAAALAVTFLGVALGNLLARQQQRRTFWRAIRGPR